MTRPARIGDRQRATAADLLLVVAAAHRPADAPHLATAAAGHTARAALAVLARTVALPTLPEPLLHEVAELLHWCEAAPAPVVAGARACAAQVAASRLPHFEPLGALDRWRRELRNGVRQLGTEDALARAARWETVALERERAGDRAGAEEAIERAAEALLAGAPGHGQAAPFIGRTPLAAVAA